ncbi:putative orfan [Tupanvirus soda lake]|uniref:Orfan n=2 Tax=Tupanvirus TaxID=2094720 RepID=A0AC62AC87_9VIRU|nr:putative orfan [Tupanvirus soda lake]QKU35329.1 putative orfan [Tupanvirus soda lake]
MLFHMIFKSYIFVHDTFIMYVRSRPKIDTKQIKKFNDQYGDVIIESLDGKILKGHSEILVRVSKFFDSNIMRTKKFSLNTII